MSKIKMLKNEKRNRRKAFMITTLFYLLSIGGILAYTGGVDISSHIPDTVKEWLQLEDQPEEAKAKEPRV